MPKRCWNFQIPRPEDVEQVKKYADDTRRKFPNYQVRQYIVYLRQPLVEMLGGIAKNSIVINHRLVIHILFVYLQKIK